MDDNSSTDTRGLLRGLNVSFYYYSNSNNDKRVIIVGQGIYYIIYSLFHQTFKTGSTVIWPEDLGECL